MAKTISRIDIARREGGVILVVRYLRVSKMGDRSLSDEAFHSPDLQIQAIDAEFDKIYGPGNWALVPVNGSFGQGTWADFDVTGRSMARAGLDAAIDAAVKHHALALGVLNVSRWARNVLGALQRVHEIRSTGTELISAKENADFKTSTGRFVTTMFFGLAQLFSDQRSDDWSELIELRANDGRHHGKPPIGYKRAEDVGRGGRGDIVPIEDQIPYIVSAFEQFANGSTRNQVWEYLHAHTGTNQSKDLGRLFTSRVYLQWHSPECAGKKGGCEEIAAHGDRGEIRAYILEDRGDGERKRRIGEEWHPGRHQGIITPELWDRVQEKLKKLEPGSRVRNFDNHELVGCIKCAYCLRSLSCQPKDSRNAGYFTDSTGRQRDKCAGPGWIHGGKVLEIVMDEIREIVAQLTPTNMQAAEPQDREQPVKKISTLSNRRKTVMDRIAGIKNEVDLGDYSGTKEEADTQVAGLRNEVTRLDKEIADWIAEKPTDKARGPYRAAELLEKWDDFTVAERNQRFRSLVKVYVTKRPNDWQRGDSYAPRLSIRWSWE